MADETIVTPPTPQAPATHTTIIHEAPASNSGLGIIMAVILLVVVVGGVYLYSQNSAQSTRDNAIAEAASDVGNAASKVGDAAQDAVNTAK